MSRNGTLLLCLLALGMFAKRVEATQTKHHYLYLFSYDDGKESPDKTHTWGSFLTLEGEADIKEIHTISWLPISGIVSLMELGPERGRNYSLQESFGLGIRQKLLLRKWGPYEISSELNTRLLTQWKRLEAGGVWYKVLDNSTRLDKVLDPPRIAVPEAINCFHALTDAVRPVDPKGFLITGKAAGIRATAMTAWHLSDWYLREPGDPHTVRSVKASVKALIDERLGLEKYRGLEEVPLKPMNNHYCATAEDCRGGMPLFD